MMQAYASIVISKEAKALGFCRTDGQNHLEIISNHMLLNPSQSISLIFFSHEMVHQRGIGITLSPFGKGWGSEVLILLLLLKIKPLGFKIIANV